MPSGPKKVKTSKAEAGVPVAKTSSIPTSTLSMPVNPDNLPVKYETLDIKEYSTASPHGPITPALMKKWLGWETEKEYQKRMVSLTPGTKAEDYKYGDEFHCFNIRGEKVRCHNNANNRPFNVTWCEDLVHTTLYGQWVGPFTLPGETINGETIRISRYGRVLSGQHQGTAVILADEFLQASRNEKNYDPLYPKFPAWNGQEHCFIETIVVTGLSEDERVLNSIDYVKPRTTADMLYTMQLYRENNSVERKELTRMLAQAIETLWGRTDTKGYKTHPEIVGFLERHKRLLNCVGQLFKINSPKDSDGGRKISKLRLSAGMCSAICYLMGCSGDGTDGDLYRNENPPSEANLDWSYQDRAYEFWMQLARHDDFVLVRDALGRLVESSRDKEENIGLGGRIGEKLALIQKAWDVFKDHPEEAGPLFTEEDFQEDGACYLNYNNLDDKGDPLPNNQIKLIDDADFGGIDCPDSISDWKKKGPDKTPPAPPPVSQEELYGDGGLADQARARREKAQQEAAVAKKPPLKPGKLDELAEQAAQRSAADKAKKEAQQPTPAKERTVERGPLNPSVKPSSGTPKKPPLRGGK